MKTFASPRFLGALASVLFALCIAGIAHAQVQPWDTNILTWAAPTTCTTGEPITSCAVTGYRVERAPSSSGPFAALAQVGAAASTYTQVGAAAGVNCYRIIANSAQGDSGPSNVACKTNTKPVGPPNPPVLATVAVISGTTLTPVYRVLGKAGATYPGEMFGLVPTGRVCEGPQVFKYRGASFRRVTVQRSEVWPATTSTTNLAAACA